VITQNRKDGFDEFLDAFIEGHRGKRMFSGGGGKEDILDFIVELGRRSDDPGARLKKIAAWLDARPDVQSCRTGEEFDLWHGDFEEIEEEIEKPPSPD